MSITTDEAVIIKAADGKATIRGSENSDIEVQQVDADEIMLFQEGEGVFMSRNEAEALFLVLDTMLHEGEETI